MQSTNHNANRIASHVHELSLLGGTWLRRLYMPPLLRRLASFLISRPRLTQAFAAADKKQQAARKAGTVRVEAIGSGAPILTLSCLDCPHVRDLLVRVRAHLDVAAAVPLYLTHNHGVKKLAVSRLTSRLLPRVVTLLRGKADPMLHGQVGGVYCAAVSGDGRVFATVSRVQARLPCRMCVWNLRTRALVCKWRFHVYYRRFRLKLNCDGSLITVWPDRYGMAPSSWQRVPAATPQKGYSSVTLFTNIYMRAESADGSVVAQLQPPMQPPVPGQPHTLNWPLLFRGGKAADFPLPRSIGHATIQVVSLTLTECGTFLILETDRRLRTFHLPSGRQFCCDKGPANGWAAAAVVPGGSRLRLALTRRRGYNSLTVRDVDIVAKKTVCEWASDGPCRMPCFLGPSTLAVVESVTQWHHSLALIPLDPKCPRPAPRRYDIVANRISTLTTAPDPSSSLLIVCTSSGQVICTSPAELELGAGRRAQAAASIAAIDL
jgi:hypothetical protein